MSGRSRALDCARIRVRTAAPLAVLCRLSGVSRSNEPAGHAESWRCFQLLFDDGSQLRDVVTLLLDDDHSALASWDDFVDHLMHCPANWYRELLRLTLLHRRELVGAALDRRPLGPDDRAEALRVARFLVPDGDSPLTDMVADLLIDPGDTLRAVLLDVLINSENGPSNSGAVSDLAGALNEAEHRIADRLIPQTPSLAYLTLTGQDVPSPHRDRLDSCDEVHFVLAPETGDAMPISYLGTSAIVPFEPCEYPVTLIMPVDVYEALGNDMRMRIVLLLARRGEMYGSQLVHHIGAPQATVSNHLGKLESAGLVRRRPHGRRTYYRLDPKALDRAAERLTQLRLAVHSPLQRELPID